MKTKYISSLRKLSKSPELKLDIKELRERLQRVELNLNSPRYHRPPLYKNQILQSPQQELHKQANVKEKYKRKHSFLSHGNSPVLSPINRSTRDRIFPKNNLQWKTSIKAVASLSPSQRYFKNLSRITEMMNKEKTLCTTKKAGTLNAGNFPISPSQAYQLYKSSLTDYELNEILAYNEIYYFGINCANKPRECTKRDGGYAIAKGDHIAYRYEILSEIGKGAFGNVLKVYDHKENMSSALKILRKSSKLEQQGQMELKVLSTLNENDPGDCHNIIRLYEQFRFRGHICFTTELLHMNLYEQLASTKYRGLPLPTVKRHCLQLLEALQLLHFLNIIHCDLKPENILLTARATPKVKLIDFGSACYENEQFFSYIQSRYYRAPEIILGIEYSKAIDMWSLGCILVELYTGTPIFPGENELRQLICIMEVLGPPPAALVARGKFSYKFFEFDGRPMLLPGPVAGSRQLRVILQGADSEFTDFIESKCYSECFEWSPEQRLSAHQAVRHPWALSKPSVIRHLSPPRMCPRLKQLFI